MKVVLLSKAFLSGAYQRQLEELACQPELSLVALVPPAWREPLIGRTVLERAYTRGYRLEVLPLVANGHHHVYFFRGLRRVLARERPDILHIDEEAFNLATFLALRAGRAVGARCCFFNWATSDRFYPLPFCFFEQYAFRYAAAALAGNQEAAALLRRHGYTGPLTVMPQVGVDPALFAPRATRAVPAAPDNPFVVGYVGRLIAWKGVQDLVDALAGLPPHVRLLLVGDGELRPHLVQRAQALGVAHRLEVRAAVRSTDVPRVLHEMDVLVLPSRTQPNWKEQFGRVLVEAMSCEVPVVGSSSGEIPFVVGDAGLIYPEGDVAALRALLLRLHGNAALRRDLGRRGRARVLAHYTQAALAQQTYAVYQAMLMG